VGEAGRRESTPPSAIELARRWMNRTLDVYPGPMTAYVRLSLQLIAAIALLAIGLLIVAALVSFIEWLMGPPLSTPI
jgi:hypothetical protein